MGKGDGEVLGGLARLALAWYVGGLCGGLIYHVASNRGIAKLGLGVNPIALAMGPIGGVAMSLTHPASACITIGTVIVGVALMRRSRTVAYILGLIGMACAVYVTSAMWNTD